MASPHRRRLSYIAVLLLPIAASVDAATHRGSVIGVLPGKLCPENSGVYETPTRPDDSLMPEICRFAFVPHWERQEPYAEAVISLDGRLVHLHRTDHRSNTLGAVVHYTLADDSGSTRVTLHASRICPVDAEGCDFAGLLTVHTPGGTTVIKVDYYRGG